MNPSVPIAATGAQVGQVLRLRLRVGGLVQGVGFRPHVYRVATELGLSGWICNARAGVVIEVEGGEVELQVFRRRMDRERPPGCSVQSVEAIWLDPVGWCGFEIRSSEGPAGGALVVRPDVATCPACVREIFDRANRRFGYPFTNCTQCGPRYSIIETLPYDRANTSMKGFVMCPECLAEYENPGDRRFHAQPNACPRCGPRLELWAADGEVMAAGAEALAETVEAIRRGEVVAVKGLGGFQLMADGRSESAVARLRRRKHREEKPFALMCPSLDSVRGLCFLSAAEEAVLEGPEAPIELLRRRAGGKCGVADGVAPDNPYLGIMLPYTPLHHLLLAALQFPLVATSGNLSDEPICIDETEARTRLGGIADLFLVHNRPIVRHVDDSVVRVVAGREMLVRRARGYAPLPVSGQPTIPRPLQPAGQPVSAKDGEASPGPIVLALGGHLKSAVALASDGAIVLSQHIGDLETPAALTAFRRVSSDLQRLFGVEPEWLVCDLHPDYLSTLEASKHPVPRMGVQHHFAHVQACMAENELDGPVLGIAWDGTGYGLDGMIWGSEFLIAEDGTYDRFATLRPFRLPGGEQAVREARRCAVGILFEHYGSGAFELVDLPPIAAFSAAELEAVRTMLQRRFNSPLTTGMGRLFDGVASLVGLRQRAAFEGQAAMALEWIVDTSRQEPPYAFHLVRALPAQGGASGPRVAVRDPQWHADWGPMIDELIHDIRAGHPPARLASRFHRALIELIAKVADRAGLERVALSGGCFQNAVLLEGAVARLRQAGHRVYWHQRVPTNDGGLAVGQAFGALRALAAGGQRGNLSAA